MASLHDLFNTQLERSYRHLAETRGTGSFRNLVVTEEVEREFDKYWLSERALFTIGTAVAPATWGGDSVAREYNFGGLIKPLDGGIDLSFRTLATIEIAAVRCFATDDPSGTDEAYLITTVYAMDPVQGDRAIFTKKIGPTDVSSDSGQNTFFHGERLDAGAFFVAGDGGVNVHVAVFDEESGDTSDLELAASRVAANAHRAGLVALATIPLVGLAAAPIAYAASEASGLSDKVGQTAAGWIRDAFGDDLVGQRTFVIDADFLRRLKAGQVQDRTSDSIPNVKYNYPEIGEDDSWLLTRGSGTGAYRVFFRIRTQNQ